MTYADEQIRLIANEMTRVQSFDPWSAKTINEAHLMLRAWLAEREESRKIDALI